jgi:adenylate kinase family enzyme
MKVAILGNSGSGESTLAQWLVERTHAALLDLDTVAWDPLQTSVARAPDAAVADVKAFCSAHQDWVVEGC